MGTKMTTSDRVMASTEKPMAWMPFSAASWGERCSSSINRTISSSTTTASSITMPTTRARASMVIWLRVIEKAAMATNPPNKEQGMATTEISVARRLPRKSQTIPPARMLPRTRCSRIS